MIGYAETFAKNVKRIIKERDISVKQLAEKTSYSKSTLKGVLTQKEEPTLTLVEEVATALGIHVFALLGGDLEDNVSVRSNTNEAIENNPPKTPQILTTQPQEALSGKDDLTITFIGIYDKYCKEHNLKPNTVKGYNAAIRKLLGDKGNKPYASLEKNDLNLAHTQTTLRQYLYSLSTIINWAISEGFCERNLFQIVVRSLPKAAPGTSTFSLVKEPRLLDFASIKEAKTFMTGFLMGLFGDNAEDYDFSANKVLLFKFWVIHITLATRITDTIKVIKEYKSGDDGVIIAINNLNYNIPPTFKVPVIEPLGDLILAVKDFVLGYKEAYFTKLINNSAPKEYKESFTSSSSRMLYRIIINLIAKNEFSTEIKELYLNKGVKTTLTDKNTREHDFYPERRSIEEKYFTWIIGAIPKKYQVNLLK